MYRVELRTAISSILFEIWCNDLIFRHEKSPCNKSCVSVITSSYTHTRTNMHSPALAYTCTHTHIALTFTLHMHSHTHWTRTYLHSLTFASRAFTRPHSRALTCMYSCALTRTHMHSCALTRTHVHLFALTLTLYSHILICTHVHSSHSCAPTLTLHSHILICTYAHSHALTLTCTRTYSHSHWTRTYLHSLTFISRAFTHPHSRSLTRMYSCALTHTPGHSFALTLTLHSHILLCTRMYSCALTLTLHSHKLICTHLHSHTLERTHTRLH